MAAATDGVIGEILVKFILLMIGFLRGDKVIEVFFPVIASKSSFLSFC